MINRKRVQRMMRQDNLLCLRRKKFIRTTDSEHGLAVYPNLVPTLDISAGVNPSAETICDSDTRRSMVFPSRRLRSAPRSSLPAHSVGKGKNARHIGEARNRLKGETLAGDPHKRSVGYSLVRETDEHDTCIDL